jgi:membrane fusion protein, copper/silver efflux system
MNPGSWSGVGRGRTRRPTISLPLLMAIAFLAGTTLVAAGCGGKGGVSGKERPAAAGAGKRAGHSGTGGTAADAEGKAGVEQGVPQAVTEEAAPGQERYICPMHPTYISDHPGDCPICGMRLVPAEKMNTGQEGNGIPGMAAIRLGAEGIRLAGVQTATAENGSVARTIRTVGIVSADESRVRRVQVKIEGYVERLFVNTPGQAVRRGDPLLAIYSPDLLAGQEEYVRAIEARKHLDGAAGTSGDPSRGGAEGSGRPSGCGPGASGSLTAGEMLTPEQGRLRDADLLVRAARERLRLLDVPPSVLEQLEQTGTPTRTITLRSPASGVVTERTAYEGMKVMPGMELFTITDLSEVWIEGSFYESEAPFLAVGRPAMVTLAYDPSVTLQGEVAFVYPYLDPESRTLRARFAFPNAERMLKPGMYANIVMDAAGEDGVIIPDDAVMDTGERKIVFLSKGDGLFEPREVDTGLRAEGKVHILAGVMAGEEVVVRANFLLDSESRIRSALSGNAPAPATGPEGHAAPTTGPEVKTPPASQDGSGAAPQMPGMPVGK